MNIVYIVPFEVKKNVFLAILILQEHTCRKLQLKEKVVVSYFCGLRKQLFLLLIRDMMQRFFIDQHG